MKRSFYASKVTGLKVAIEWEASTDGSINCAPSEMSGCGNHKLELQRIHDKDWISRLELRARNLLEIGKIEHTTQKHNCSEIGDKMLQKSASREDTLTITCIVQNQGRFWMKRSFYVSEVNGIKVNLS
ncbi:lysine-specific demethylase JMJ26-like [Syzygium oleosum]|uniref:lysine-specific demethylase JMJ26-like n=1 Tax=Syzygium oleosum TaxID=219896 RepID=UPI0024B9A8E6|nr:lysine-specific demethylase JMJ26-like [Syzygium oleosum]